MLVGGIVDADLPWLEPNTSLPALTRYFAAYNLVCGPVLDAQHHLLGAVSVDDVLDHLLPHDWRATNDEPALDAFMRSSRAAAMFSKPLITMTRVD